MSNFDWESKRDIEESVEQLGFSRVKRFYPTYIHKITNVPLDRVFDYLLILVEDGRLNLKWEIRCPDLYCGSKIKRIEKIETYLHETIECPDCENEFCVRESMTFPVFEINPSYRARIREIKKKDRNLLKVL